MSAKNQIVLRRGALGALASGVMVAFGALSAGVTEYFATAEEVDDATCDCSSVANAYRLTRRSPARDFGLDGGDEAIRPAQGRDCHPRSG